MGSRAWDTVGGGPEFDAFEHFTRGASVKYVGSIQVIDMINLWLTGLPVHATHRH